MKRVAIVGAGQTKYGDFPKQGIKELFLDAYTEMLDSVEKGIDPKKIEAAYIGCLSAGSGFQLGQMASLLTGYAGLPNIPAYRLENACASGGFALLAGIHAILSGEHEYVLVAGVEKMRDVSSKKGRYWLGISGDTEYERLAGLTFPGIYASIAQRYIHDYTFKKEHLSMIAVKNHKNASLNKKSHLGKEIDLETAVKGPEVAYPLNLWDCCPTSDGAAAVLLTTEKNAKKLTNDPVYIIGWGGAGDHLAIHDRNKVTSLSAVVEAGKKAYQRAGVKPSDIDFAEVHDCFTIAEALSYGDLGFCEVGRAGTLIESGETCIDGKLPINVSGGLKAKGHPIGATGIGMAYEITQQLRRKVTPERQIQNAQLGLSHNVGGSGGTAVVCIYTI